MPLGPLRTILGVKTFLMLKWSFFFEVIYDPNDPISTHMNFKRMPNSKSAHQITSGAQKLEK